MVFIFVQGTMLRQELGTNITAIVNRLASELQNTPFYPDFLADVQVVVIRLLLYFNYYHTIAFSLICVSHIMLDF